MKSATKPWNCLSGLARIKKKFFEVNSSHVGHCNRKQIFSVLESQLRRKDWRGCLVECPSVWICFSGGCLCSRNPISVFGQEAAATRVGEPQRLTLSFPGQQSRQPLLSFPSVEMLQLAGFPDGRLLPFLDFPMHELSQESCNYGAS